ncbi:MAG: alpha-N-arabinofuranosidase [Cyclobacteriaceae bacterium]
MKQIGLVLLSILALGSSAQENKIVVDLTSAKDTISKHIYGHFAEHLGRCIYGGIYVGEDSNIPNQNGIRLDVVDALKELDIPVLRWPGGCFAEQYHWRHGIGPKEQRPKTVNAFWGDVTEDNSFGTHEFLELCEMLDTEPYIAVNIASGTVKDVYEWIEYVTSDNDSYITQMRKDNGREEPWDVKFWGIGNENWGCGGNMDAAYYTDVFKRYSTYCKADYKIASGGLWHDLDWTRTFMEGVKNNMDLAQGMSYHYYTIVHNWSKKGSATDFDKSEWFKTMKHTMAMEENLEEHIAIMDEVDPENNVALIADEWGSWYDVEPGTNPAFLYQQNTLRDALLASVGFNIFNNHADRIKMANIAQTVNVLQAMILTKDEFMVKTPSYYAFKMYKVHQDALLLPTDVTAQTFAVEDDEEIPAITTSASKSKNGDINITLSNLDPDKDINTTISFKGLSKLGTISGQIITGDEMNAMNDFGKEEAVNLESFKGFKKSKSSIDINMPSKSIVLLTIKEK